MSRRLGSVVAAAMAVLAGAAVGYLQWRFTDAVDVRFVLLAGAAVASGTMWSLDRIGLLEEADAALRMLDPDAVGADPQDWKRPYRPIGPGSDPVLPPQE